MTDADPGYEMHVERGKVREFARATGSSAPEYLDRADPPIPVTFLRTDTFWRPPDAPSPMAGIKLNVARILHGEQEYVFFGPPPRAGTTLTVQSRLESVTEKEGRRGGTMRLIVTVEDFLDEEGRLVAQGRSTLIETGEGAVVTAHESGATLPERSFGPLTRTDFVKYQGASGDFNPIHHDEEFAQKAGFPTVFSVGMLQAGYLATYATDLFGPDNVRRFAIRFREQVWPGDTITCRGVVGERRHDETLDEDVVDLDLEAVTQQGAVAIAASATFARAASEQRA